MVTAEELLEDILNITRSILEVLVAQLPEEIKNELNTAVVIAQSREAQL
jgi:hypothetical protein